MVFSTSFSYSSRSPLEVSTTDDQALKLLHDFELVLRLNPDCKRFQLTQDKPAGIEIPDNASVYDCEGALNFIPNWLWDGGVWYKTVYVPDSKGCDVIVKAPGGFSSINKWKLEIGDDGTKFISIDSQCKCSRTFAWAVERFLPSSHATQQDRFRKKLAELYGTDTQAEPSRGSAGP